MSRFFIYRPDFCLRDFDHHRDRRSRIVRIAAGRKVSTDRAANRQCQAIYPGGDARTIAETVATPIEQAGQWRRRHDLHVFQQCQRRHLQSNRHV